MITKIANALQSTIDGGTIFLAFCIAAWWSLADAHDVQQYGLTAKVTLFAALAGLVSLNLLKVVIKLFQDKEIA
ncbi:MAG: hypothetical protein JAZ17_17430 [Candidatus Thiodiazotropha endolucinida]|nr:hypothetical protein [Candidatus Thiodiazotropha taylori]MCG8095372.1 hypothetical protein [Candidatus Thiodiazotropha endolucinida]MCW4268774.1 hypothetical protein [Candidatus Thiodiazotropha endolucinida]